MSQPKVKSTTEKKPARVKVSSFLVEPALYKAKTLLEALGIEHDMFFEPDGNTGHSATGTRPLLDTERPLLRGYPLWKLKAGRAEGAAA